jgi:EAL domain-containing protein (putative c-di-GMP-specific phosphodiesterase class I)
MLSINFMPRAVYRPELCIRSTLEAAEKHQFNHRRIIFEFNEAEQVDDISHLKNIVETYRAMGFKTAIDDFGAGYSGLNLLTELQPDILKLDMHLIRGIDTCHKRQAIVSALVRMCQDLGIDIIAEGIETVDEHGAIVGLGIHLLQGFLYAQPQFKNFLDSASISFK